MTTRVALTMRITEAVGDRETRDSIGHDWPKKTVYRIHCADPEGKRRWKLSTEVPKI